MLGGVRRLNAVRSCGSDDLRDSREGRLAWACVARGS